MLVAVQGTRSTGDPLKAHLRRCTKNIIRGITPLLSVFEARLCGRIKIFVAISKERSSGSDGSVRF